MFNGTRNLFYVTLIKGVLTMHSIRVVNGKVRTSEAKVIREVPLEECGLFGKILARRRVIK